MGHIWRLGYMTFSNQLMAMNMSFGREYSGRYDWLLTQVKDWAFTFVYSYLYYKDYDKNDETIRDLYRQGMAAFGGIAPTYHIALLDKPTIVWDFHSLLLGVQMMFSFMLTGEIESASRLPPLPEGVYCRTPECRLLLTTVQKSV